HRVSRSLFVFFDFAVLHRDLHSFPTRRSSDLFFALTIDFMAISFQDWLKLVFYTDFQQTLATKISFLFSTLRLLSYGILLISTSDRKSTRLNSSHVQSSYAVFCLKNKKRHNQR